MHTAQTCYGFRLAVGGNPPLYDFANGICGRLAHLSVKMHNEETDDLETLAGRNDREVFCVFEHSFSAVKHFKLLSAMGAGATAKAFRKSVFAFPTVSALGTSEDTALCPVGIVLETMLSC